MFVTAVTNCVARRAGRQPTNHPNAILRHLSLLPLSFMFAQCDILFKMRFIAHLTSRRLPTQPATPKVPAVVEIYVSEDLSFVRCCLHPSLPPSLHAVLYFTISRLHTYFPHPLFLFLSFFLAEPPPLRPQTENTRKIRRKSKKASSFPQALVRRWPIGLCGGCEHHGFSLKQS